MTKRIKTTLSTFQHNHKVVCHALIFCGMVAFVVVFREHELSIVAVGYKAIEVLCDVVCDRVFPEKFFDNQD